MSPATFCNTEIFAGINFCQYGKSLTQAKNLQDMNFAMRTGGKIGENNIILLAKVFSYIMVANNHSCIKINIKHDLIGAL